MEAEGESSQPFLPSTVLCREGDICFVHYQTRSPAVLSCDSANSLNFSDLVEKPPWGMPAEVALIRARQEAEAAKLIEANLSEPYRITVYRYFLRRWPYLSIFAYKESLLVGVVISKLDCRDDVCLIHGSYSSSEICTCENCDIVGTAYGKDATLCKDAGSAALSDRKAVSSPDEQLPTRMSEIQRQSPRPTGKEAEQYTEVPPSSALLCTCHGQCTASITMLAVRPEMRGQGIGKQLVRLALQQQQRFVRATQAAALAAAPECATEQREICRIILTDSPLPPNLSTAMPRKPREAAVAVEYAMAHIQNGHDAVQKQNTECLGQRCAGKYIGKQLPFRLKYCWLEMEAGNTPALRLYTSVGFVVAHYKRRYYCNGKDGYKLLYTFRS